MRYVHCPESERTCMRCGVILSNIPSKQRHQQTCSETKKLWKPPSPTPSDGNENGRHAHNNSKISDIGESLLIRFKKWLSDGGLSIKLMAYKRVLSKNSISTYAHHLRRFFAFLESSKFSPPNTICSLSVEIRVIKSFIEYNNASGYKKKTIINRLFSLERWLGFLDDQAGKNDLPKKKDVDKKITECLEFIRAETKVLSPIATRETQVRNCRESLEEDGKWEDLPNVLNGLESLKEETELMLQQFENLNECDSRPLFSDLLLIQDYVIFNLIVKRPTMRSQNFILEIMDKLQSPKLASKNGIVVFSRDRVVLQYTKYKTQQ